MKKLISVPFVLLFCLMMGQVQADGHETPPIIDTFSCNLAPGQTMEDAMEASEYWAEQVGKIDELDSLAAWVITPIRSSLPADFYWLGASPNLNAWAKGNMAYVSSPRFDDINEKFAEVGDCSSGMWTSEMLMGGSPPEEGDTNSILEAYGCNLHEGKTMANVRAVEANYVKAAEEAGLAQNIFRFSPMYTNGQTDLLYFVGYDDLESYAATATAASTTPSTSTANAYFGLVMDCGAGLYSVENIKAPPAAEE